MKREVDGVENAHSAKCSRRAQEENVSWGRQGIGLQTRKPGSLKNRRDEGAGKAFEVVAGCALARFEPPSGNFGSCREKKKRTCIITLIFILVIFSDSMYVTRMDFRHGNFSKFPNSDYTKISDYKIFVSSLHQRRPHQEMSHHVFVRLMLEFISRIG